MAQSRQITWLLGTLSEPPPRAFNALCSLPQQVVLLRSTSFSSHVLA